MKSVRARTRLSVAAYALVAVASVVLLVSTEDDALRIALLLVLISAILGVALALHQARRVRLQEPSHTTAPAPASEVDDTDATTPDLDRAGRTDLHYAALENRVDDLRRLVEQGADVNLADKNGYTPLHFAAQEHAIEALRYLLSAGARLELEDAYGNTPLWRATISSRGRGDAITLLRSAGADPWHANKTGSSPVTIATRVSNFDIRQWYADLEDSPPAD